MKISVIIPSYQPEEYLFDCLDSLNNQDFPHDNFEIIIILNGIQYPYENNILDYIKNKFLFISVRYFYCETKGVSNARNIGIENAKGDYLCFVDDDDLLSPNYLTQLYKFTKNDGVVVSNVKTFTKNLSELHDDYLSKSYLSNLTSNPNSIFKLRSFLSTSCCKLIPKEIINEGRFDANLSIGEDSLFMFLLSDKIKFIYLCPEASAVYYRRIRQTSAYLKKKSFVEKINIVWLLIKKYTSVYFSNTFHYSFKLYLSRIVAAILKLF